jgi:hypothetical protein
MQPVLFDSSIYITAIRNGDEAALSLRRLAVDSPIWLSAVVLEELYAEIAPRCRQMIRGMHVALFDEAFPVFAIHGRVGGRPGGQAIDVAVVHAESRGDQYGVVNLLIRCATLPCTSDITFGNPLATFLHLASDGQQGLQLVRNRRSFEVRLSP